MSEKIDAIINEEENDLLVEFKKPFKWEDKEYKSVDLSPLDNMSGRQLSEIYKEYGKLGIAAAIPAQTPAFAALTASKATGLPVEFFHSLPARELFKISVSVSSYFFTED